MRAIEKQGRRKANFKAKYNSKGVKSSGGAGSLNKGAMEQNNWGQIMGGRSPRAA